MVDAGLLLWCIVQRMNNRPFVGAELDLETREDYARPLEP
jgi:hypothetical protein